ncbi:hypothetical protein CPB83DRAFT_858105 [Crepidotus variabilis]|uniref:Uncharacterized protein n=1 Tax=Crepidotus variabilis TaxID=179855 RepID=A0A9P6JMY0_9AGAR|nr:hypothetical protein CPB83DRAFT_858105 [Crepidotus variabilis]
MLVSIHVSLVTLLGFAGLSAMTAARSLNQTSAFDRELHLFPRQVPSVPPQCDSTCEPINVLINGRCTPKMCCTASFAQSFFDCYKCSAEAFGLTDYTQAQQVLDGLVGTCAGVGVLLPQLTFPGQNPSRTLSSVVLGPTNSAGTGTLTIPTGTLNPPKTTVGTPPGSHSLTIITSNTQSVVSTPTGSVTTAGTGSGSNSASMTANSPGASPSSGCSNKKNAKGSLLAIAGAVAALFMI